MRSLQQFRGGRALLAIVTLLVAACRDAATVAATGALTLRVTGLPAGTPASIVLARHASAARKLTATADLDDLAPGEYTLRSEPVEVRGTIFRPDVPVSSVRIVAGRATTKAIDYHIATGAAVVTPVGLPLEMAVSFVLTGPDGYRRTVAGHDTVVGLPPGRYAVVPSPVGTPTDRWAPERPAEEVEVTASAIPAELTIRYRLATGRLALEVRELPADGGTPIRISGPDGFTAALGSSRLITGLAPGRYTVSARSVASGDGPWGGVPALQELDVVAGETPTRAEVRYTRRPPFDLSIGGVTITQSVQRPDNSIPLVAGKPGLLRVAVLANEANLESATVRVRLASGAALLLDTTLARPVPGVPRSHLEDDLSATWNLFVHGDLLRPGVTLAVEVDGDDRIAELNEANNRHPASGATALDVRTVPPLAMRIVPITHAASGLTGDPSSALASLDFVRRLYPIGELTAAVHAPIVTSAPALQSDDRNGAWSQILSELAALRVAESASETYFGVLRTPYANGVAGLATIGEPVALGWDGRGRPTESIVAHELGHTWGRLHSPCGRPAEVDANFPNASGATGALGVDVVEGSLHLPTSPDIMGYCNAPWIGDYTYEGVLDFRGSASAPLVALAAREAPAQPCLLVWGRVTARGETILEPAFEVVARPSLPSRPGAHAVRGRAASGEELFALSFDATPVSDRANADRIFAFAVPLEPARRDRLVSLHAGGTRTTEQVVRRGRGAGESPRVARTDASSSRLRWDADAHPAALLREIATGRLLGIVRGGDARLPRGTEVEVILSDGVRSAVSRHR